MAEINSRIRFKRCNNTSINSHTEDTLPSGTPLYNTDTGELFVGDGVKKINNEFTTTSDANNRLNSISANKLISKKEKNSGKQNELNITPSSATLKEGPFYSDEIGIKDTSSNTAGFNINCAEGKGISIGPSDVNTLTKESILINASIESENSSMSGEGAVAIGRTTDPANSLKASGLNSIAIGTNAQSTAEGAIAIGNGSNATEKDQVVLGKYDFFKIFENDTVTAKAATMLASLSRGSFYTSTNESTGAKVTYNGYRVFLGKCDVPGSITKKDTYLTFVKGENAIQFISNFRSKAVVIKSNVKTEFNEKFLYCFVSRDVHGISSDYNEGAGFASDISDDRSVLTIHPNNSVGNPTLIIISTLDNYYYDTEG